MDSVSITVNDEAPLLFGSNGASESWQMDPDIFSAAAKGNIEHFKDVARNVIERSLTPTKSTILHINIISQNAKKVSTKFVEEILEKCPSLLQQVNAKGDTPLHLAARFGHSAIVRVLIERAKLAQHKDEEPESGVRATRQMIRMTNYVKNTALHEAVSIDSVDVVKILTREDPHYTYSANNYGQTPLYLAAWKGSYKMVFELLENCTSMSYEGPKGKTALHAAVLWDRSSYYDNNVMKQLFEKMKSLIKETDEYGWTPLHYAAYHNGHSMVELILDFDRSTSNIADKDRKMTALHMAAGRGHAKIVKAIISRTPECFELVDNWGWNFLHYAMASFSAKEIKNLLKNPLAIDLINEKDAKGNTPLHVLAATRRNASVDIVSPNSKGNYQAVNEENVSVEHMSTYGCPELQNEIQELSKDVGSGQYSKGVVSVRKRELEDEDRIEYEKVRASHLVVAALIATVTFAAAFTVPGGYRSDNGTAILRRNTAFQAFIITDTIAMILSLSAVFVHFMMSIHSNREFWGLSFFASISTVISMLAMVIAFVTGTYAMLAPSLGLAISTCFIGLSFFLLMFYIFRKID